MTYFIGIDPGKSGGLVALSSSGKIEEASVMPSTETDIANWFGGYSNLINGHNYALIEKVHAMPGQGVTSMFTFGRNFGFLRACLCCNEIPFNEIQPREWQKAFGIPSKKKTENKRQFKIRLLEKAQQLFPSFPLWKEPRALGRQLSICDALLIAEFCRRIYG